MKILNEGKKLKAVFECQVCGCEFEANIEECYIEYTYAMTYRAQYDCPCCGKTCNCDKSDFQEVVDNGT